MHTLYTFLILLLFSTQLTFGQSLTTDREAGELLIQLTPGKSAEKLNQLTSEFAEFGLQDARLLSESMNIWMVHFDENVNTAAKLLQKIQQHPAVSLAQFNHLVYERETIPNDPSFTALWALKNMGQMSGTPGADIEATFAWDITTSGYTPDGDTIVIAVIDGGIDLGHEDLQLWKNSHEIPNNGIDDDGNGYVDDYHGWNAYMNSGNMQQNDHGSHVAGIAAAIGNNARGVAGVAFNTHVMPIAGSGTNEAVVVKAYSYVFSQRKLYNETNGERGAFAVVTNSSFGIDGGDPLNYPLWGAMYDSLGSVGILNVASTANRAWDVDVNGDIPTTMPNESLVAVTNTTNNDELYSSAGWGLLNIDLAAPGTNIYSTRQGGQYGYKTGTSMSSPHVSGAIALMYAAADEATISLYKTNPVLVSSRFKRYLIASVDTIPSLLGRTVSGGRLNLFKLLQTVQNPPDFNVTPASLDLAIAPENSTQTAIEINPLGALRNSYTIAVPDSATWLTLSGYAGTLLPGIPSFINLQINATGLVEGLYTSSLTITDDFLNSTIVPIELKVRIGVDAAAYIPIQTGIKIWPNPVTSASRISFSLSSPGKVNLSVFSVDGRQSITLVDGFYPAGRHELNWPEFSQKGLLLLRMKSDEGVITKKVVIY